MKFIVSSSVLLKQLNSINGIVCVNPIVPILEKFLFQLENQNLECNVNSAQDISCKINTTENTLEAQFILKTDADDIDEIIFEIYKALWPYTLFRFIQRRNFQSSLTTLRKCSKQYRNDGLLLFEP